MNELMIEKGKKLHEQVEELKRLKYSATMNIFMIGKILTEVKEEGTYAEMYGTFNEFLAQPEISFSRATAFKAMKLYEKYVSQLDCLETVKMIPAEKLYAVSEVIDETNAADWIDKARELSRSDLSFEVNRALGRNVVDPAEMPLYTKLDEFLKCFPLDQREGIRMLVNRWENFKKSGSPDLG